MQKTLKLTTKTNSNLLKEVAQHEALKIKTSSPKQPYCYIYRRDGDPDFISTFLKELNDNVSYETEHHRVVMSVAKRTC